MPGSSASVIVESDYLGETILMDIPDFTVVNAKTVKILVFDENGTELFSVEVSFVK